MRLICPNCGAQYEVDERVIPDAGRDVQCSNCGHAWFQLPEGARAKPAQEASSATETAPQEDPADDARPPVEAQIPEQNEDAVSDEEPTPDPTPEPELEPEPEPMPEPGPDPAPEPEPEQTPEPAPAATRQALDDGVRNILREEAEREARAREGEQLETQDELALDTSSAPQDQRGMAAQERMARLRGLDVEDDTTASGGTGARRDLLPDIEEINSSLDSIGSEETVDDFADDGGRRKSGFGRGFVLMLLLAAVLVALYLYAPQISAKVPALAPALDGFVALVDQARAWLDNLVKLALSKVQSAE